MLYLIRSFGRGSRSLVKVGYSDNLGKRMDNYYHSNPLFEKLCVREGSEIDEKKLQLYLEVLGWKESILVEWFKDDPSVLSLFHERWEKINRTLWRRRNEIWQKSDIARGADKRMRLIYEELRARYYREGQSCEPGSIDWEYKFLRSRETLKAVRETLNSY